MDAVSKNYSNRCQSQGWTYECSCSVCSQCASKYSSFLFFLLSPMLLELRVGVKVSLYCVMHHRWESQSLLLLLSAGAHLPCIGWEVYQESSDVNGSILLMCFGFFFCFPEQLFWIFHFFFCNLWTRFLFFMRERLGNGVGRREDTHIFECQQHFHFWFLAWKLCLSLLLACCLNMVQW